MEEQFARNVWAMNLEVQNEAAKQVYIQSGNLNWNSLTLAEKDQAMFNILILLTTTAAPGRSVLVDSPYRNIPKRKLESYLESEKDENTSAQIRAPLVTYVNYVLGQPVNESLEVNILKLDLEATTNISADTVDMLCAQLKNTDLGESNAVPTVAVIHELTKKYNAEELVKITANEFFFESTSRKIVEKIQFEEEEKLQMSEKKRRSQQETATEQWIENFIKPEFRLSFLTLLKFNLGQKLIKRGETLLEVLGITQSQAEDRIVVHEDMDRLLFYLSSLFLLTNMSTYPIIGSPPTLQEVMQILRGEIVKAKLPSFYAVPPLRLCKEGAVKRRNHDQDQETMHAKRSYQKQHNVQYGQPALY